MQKKLQSKPLGGLVQKKICKKLLTGYEGFANRSNNYNSL